MKKILALILALILLCSCGTSEIPEELTGELEQNPGETCTLPEDIINNDKEENPEEVFSRTKRPEPEKFTFIYFWENEGEIYTVEIEETAMEEFAGCLKWKSWVGPAVETSLIPDKWNPMETVLLDKAGNRLEVYSNGTETIIKLIWGENWENTEYFMASQKVAVNTRAFCNDLIQNSEIYKELIGDALLVPERPEIEDFDQIWTAGSEGGGRQYMITMTAEEYKKIQTALDKNSWVEYDPKVHVVDADELGPNGNNTELYISSDSLGETVNFNRLYIKVYGEYTMITLRYNRNDEKIWIAPAEVAKNIGKLKEEIYEATKKDGRNPFIPYLADEVNYLPAPEIDINAFEAHLLNFVGHISGEYNEYNRLSPEESVLWCAAQAYKISVENGEEIRYDEHGRIMVSEEKIKTAARYIFGIEDITTCVDFEDGYYTLPFGGKIINPKVTLIEFDDGYIYCEAEFYDPDDFAFEGEPYAKKCYTFKAFEAEGRIWYRAVSGSFIFGSEWYF